MPARPRGTSRAPEEVMETNLDAPRRTRSQLLAQHASLGALFERVLAAFATNDSRLVCSVWTELESAVLEHMSREEHGFYPSFHAVDPVEAQTLLAEHRALRRDLAELGIASDLHLCRYEQARALVQRLRAHIARENALAGRCVTPG